MAAIGTTTAAYEALTQGCGLVDRSERGKLALTGSGAKEFLAGQVTNDTVGLTPGTGVYAAFLTHKGKMVGDLRIIEVGPPTPELWLDTERATLQALFDVIRRFKIGFDVELHKRTVQQALFSLVGPRAREVAGAGDLGPDEHANMGGDLGLLIATDGGVDVVCAAEDAERTRATLTERGAVVVAEADADVVRVERGRPRYGVDMDDTTIPQEAGLNSRAVSFTKGCYVGQETVARLFYKGKPNRHLRGLRLSAPSPGGEELRLGEKVVGRVGTSVVSPAHGPIALALVRREAEPGATLAVGSGETTATVVELPFA